MYRKIVEKRLASEIKVIKRLHPELNMDSLFSADELAKAVDKITADTYNIKSGARPAITAVSKFIDSKLLSRARSIFFILTILLLLNRYKEKKDKKSSNYIIRICHTHRISR